jgi:hypothetical protein
LTEGMRAMQTLWAGNQCPIRMFWRNLFSNRVFGFVRGKVIQVST